MERLVRFELLDQEYSFFTGAPENEVAEVMELVRTLVEENLSGGTRGTIPLSKVAILVSLNIASRYCELKSEFERYKSETEHRISGLARQIDSGLSLEKGEQEG